MWWTAGGEFVVVVAALAVAAVGTLAVAAAGKQPQLQLLMLEPYYLTFDEHSYYFVK